MKIVKAKIKDSNSEWEEPFEMEEELDSKSEVQRFIDLFNSGLSNKKEHRKLIGITDEANKIDVYDWEAVVKDSEKFLYYAKRQFNNAYGNAGVKADYSKIKGAYSKFLRGIYGDFCALITEHASLAYDDMTFLKNLTKDEYKKLREEYKKSLKP